MLAEIPKEFWECGVCGLALGNDHRRCLMQFRWEANMVEAWKNDCEKNGRRRMERELVTLAPEHTWVRRDGRAVTLPPGRYYIGDICYAITDDTIYRGIFGACDYGDGCYTNGQKLFVVGRTAYGDGSYKGTNGFTYGVDAGVIGIVREGLFNEAEVGKLGTFHTFTEPVRVKMNSGIFTFTSGHETITINTQGYWDEDGDTDEEN